LTWLDTAYNEINRNSIFKADVSVLYRFVSDDTGALSDRTASFANDTYSASVNLACGWEAAA
jgi:hypothetical protein